MKTGWLLILLNFVVANLAVSAEIQQKLILNSTVSSPFHTPENNGCLDQYYARIFLAFNIKIEIVEYPAKRALELANKGEIDGDIIRFSGFESEYPNLLRVPVPVYQSELTVISSEPIIDSVESILRDKKIGVILSSGLISRWIVKENQLIARDYKQLASLLKAKRIRYALIPVDVLYGLEQSTSTKFFFKHTEEGESLDAYLYLHKKHQALIPGLVEIMSKPENLENGFSIACSEFRKKIKHQYHL